MPYPTPYTELFSNQFTYFDWREVAENTEKGGSNFADDAQEDVLVGYIPWNKRRDALKFFKGFAVADQGSPWRLRRVQPHRHPDYPWLRAYDVSFSGVVLQANALNPNSSPYDESPFDDSRRTRFTHALTTVRYRAHKNCRFLEDDDPNLTQPSDEWRRNVIIDPPQPLVEALTVTGGLSQLQFAETGATGPTVHTPFGVPLGERQLKLAFRMLWMHVPWNYLTENEFVFQPTRIMDALGTVNDTLCFSDVAQGFAAETLYFGGVQFSFFPLWAVSTDLTQPLMFVNVLFDFHYFNPPLGASVPYRKGWNNMPWGGNGTIGSDGLYYYCTRNGNLPNHPTDPGAPFIRTSNFNDMFKHVQDII